MVDKRLNDSGKNWRHVFKALILLDYLLQNGSEQVIAYTKENLYVVKTLKEFQYIDDEGRDQGINGNLYLAYNSATKESGCHCFVE